MRWPHTEPEGVGLPHRAPRRACAVIGNVFNAADSNSLTGTQGVEIDLHIKTRADAPYKAAGGNYLKDDANGTPTFGEINLQGPDALGTRSVPLTFAFKRHDTGAEVQIPFMQFTLFDFDHNNGASDRKGEEVRPLPPAPPAHLRPRPRPPPPPPPHPSLRITPSDPRRALTGCVTRIAVRDRLGIRGLRGLQRAGRHLFGRWRSRYYQGGHGKPQVRRRHQYRRAHLEPASRLAARSDPRAAVVCSRRPPPRTAQGDGARWTGAPEATTRPTQ